MRENHTPAAVSFELQFIEGIALKGVSKGNTTNGELATDPSLMSFARSSRYAFHLSPMTFPHEKQRTGII
jgi:hypothetical protein